jgi:Uma2 family endonuclease
MTTRVTDYKEAVAHLPTGGTLIFEDVSWEDYEELADLLESRPGWRLAYDEGKLLVMSPRPKHERYKRIIEQIIDVFTDESGIDAESFGSATWKRKPDKGAEGDTCYYVASAEQIIGKLDIDLRKDPPPDLMIEIDSTNESIGKFSIYAALRVSEIWRYDVKHNAIHFYELRGNNYAEISSSRSFPMLTPEVLVKFIEMSKTQGKNKAMAAFRAWLRRSVK